MQFNDLILLWPLILYSILKLSSANALIGDDVVDAEEKKFPFVVSIGYTDKYKYVDEKHICGGVLITNQHVLTAAHCLKSPMPESVQVTIGSVDLRRGRAFSSNKWIIYGDWANLSETSCMYKMNDIAVLKLTEEVNEPTIKPAKMGWEKIRRLYGKNATIVGWGDSNGTPSQTLKEATVTILNYNKSKKTMKKINSDNYFPCAKYFYTNAEPHVLTEMGDSGGPLIYGKHFVIGINLGTSPTNICRDKFSEDFLNKHRINAHIGIVPCRSFIDYSIANL